MTPQPLYLSGRSLLVTYWAGGWVDPGRDTVEKRKFVPMPGIELRLFYYPAHTLVAIPTEITSLINNFNKNSNNNNNIFVIILIHGSVSGSQIFM
jgi:hypothetical protein